MTEPTAPPDADLDPVTVAAEARVREALPGAIEEAVTEGGHPYLRVKAEHVHAVCELLRDDPALAYDCCHAVTGVDWPKEKEVEVVYHLVSYARRPDDAYRRRRLEGHAKNDGFLVVKVRVPRDAPRVPTVSDLWTGADWHERETWDLLGVEFTGREDLRRILLPEDWPGHPLRKDWTFPVSYHGVPVIPPEAQ
jgi:NADH-quinone oxidoreductase subunit C